MPPGIPHAVYTPVDSLVAGGFFPSPLDVASSLRVLLFLEENPHRTNDDPLPQTWDTYIVCFRDLMRKAQEPQTNQDEVARVCECLQWSLEDFLKKKPREPRTYSIGVNNKAFDIRVRKDNWVGQLKPIIESLAN